MEIRLKVEDSICEISGEPEKALIKLQSENFETPWMGLEALNKAQDILRSILGTKKKPQTIDNADNLLQEQNPATSSVAQSPEPSIPTFPIDSIRSSSRSNQLTPQEIEDLKAFQNDLVELIENPPQMNDSSSSGDGLSEKDIRGLISDHHRRFRDPSALFPICSRVLGMSKERFDQIIKMIKRG